jgi:hypothetical protein
MVRKGGFEPPRLSAPPPQDGVSASSTTSARYNCYALNSLATSVPEGNPECTGSCADLLHSTRVSGRGGFRSRSEQFLHRIFAPTAYSDMVVLMLSCPATYCKVNVPYTRQLQ